MTVTTVSWHTRFMSTRKEELLNGAVSYLLENGLANVSLRPMAAQLGTSPRILMFHFKSKERLLQEVMQALQARLQSSFARVSKRERKMTPPLKLFWAWATEKRNLPYLRLLYEAQIIATQNPKVYGLYLQKVSLDWQHVVLETLSPSLRSKDLATLCIAVFDGLFLEMIITGERSRLTNALDRFIALASSAKR
ncbi:MAG TPA: TetR/AcrR family transcriptional regulator [Terriglobales bacterium]|nr:TetR/AcrR family transcriptional regulator [Terriglobales bacterium]